jgi:kojibiose phosphorylase
MEEHTLRAIIFDMDGVLAATLEYHYHSWCKALEPHEIPFTRQDNEKIRSLTRKQSLATILVGRQLPAEIQDAILKSKNDYYLEYIRHITQEDVLPGVWSLLDEIRTGGVLCAVASSSSNARPVLRQLGLIDRIHIVVDANDISRSKPAPDIYLRAALELGVAPGECLALDDSPAGIYAAARAGMCPVAVGSSACIQAAQTCLADLVGVYLSTLRQIYVAWIGRTHPSTAFTAYWD